MNQLQELLESMKAMKFPRMTILGDLQKLFRNPADWWVNNDNPRKWPKEEPNKTTMSYPNQEWTIHVSEHLAQQNYNPNCQHCQVLQINLQNDTFSEYSDEV